MSSEEVRKLAAIMFTDMVGFSRLMHENEDHALKLLDEHDKIVNDVVARQGGTLLKRMGDAVFADFPSATSAVTCAIEIQTRLRDYNEDKPREGPIIIRIGIHVGDVVIRDDDLFGDGINVAARLEPLSEPGGGCLSQAVYQAIKAHSEIKPILVGEVELKNILEKQVIYKIPPLYTSEESDTDGSAPFTSRHESLHFRVNRIDKLPGAKRTPLSMGILGALAVPLGVFLGVLTLAIFPRADDRYRIWADELARPTQIVTALQRRENSAHTRIWESLNREARQLIDSFAPASANEEVSAEASRELRNGLNRLIQGTGLVFDDAIVSELNVPTDLRDLIAESPTRDNLKRANRLLIEAAFVGQIQRYVSEPSFEDAVARQLSAVGSSLPVILMLISATAFIAWLSAYSGSLTTIRISFRDVRDVDGVLEYFISEMGFKSPERQGDTLVFRAAWRIILHHNIIKLKAKVSGNRVVLTGPNAMMRRLQKRILSFAEK